MEAKEDFTEEDGNKASELEAEFADMNGWIVIIIIPKSPRLPIRNSHA